MTRLWGCGCGGTLAERKDKGRPPLYATPACRKTAKRVKRKVGRRSARLAEDAQEWAAWDSRRQRPPLTLTVADPGRLVSEMVDYQIFQSDPESDADADTGGLGRGRLLGRRGVSPPVRRGRLRGDHHAGKVGAGYVRHPACRGRPGRGHTSLARTPRLMVLQRGAA